MTQFSELKPGEQVLIAPLAKEANERPQWLTVTKRAGKYAYLQGDLRIELDSGHLFSGFQWLPYHGVFNSESEYQAAIRTLALAAQISQRCQLSTPLTQLGLQRLEQIAVLLNVEV